MTLVMPALTGRTAACLLGRHDIQSIDAIRPLEGSSWLLDTECRFPRRVGTQWCPGSERRHDHIPVRRCIRCGADR